METSRAYNGTRYMCWGKGPTSGLAIQSYVSLTYVQIKYYDSRQVDDQVNDGTIHQCHLLMSSIDSGTTCWHIMYVVTIDGTSILTLLTPVHPAWSSLFLIMCRREKIVMALVRLGLPHKGRYFSSLRTQHIVYITMITTPHDLVNIWTTAWLSYHICHIMT